MKRLIIQIIIIANAIMGIVMNASAQDTMTGMFRDDIKTLQVSVNKDEMALPVIILNTGDQITFEFDHLSDEREYLRCELIHCNSDWKKSQLVDTEFLDGFNEGIIEDYSQAQITTTLYYHYWLTIPNEYISPKLSGNYILRVYPEEDPDDTWLQCRFMVSEQTADIKASLTSRTDIDYNKGHQQLTIEVNSERSNVQDPFNDLIVKVMQNGRVDNEVTLRQPLRMSGRSVSIYDHQKPLIFEAGNEYRRMETISVAFPTMGVEEISYHEPYYHMSLYTDEPRSDKMHLYDETQHGRFKIREYNSDESDTEADYVVVHFTLDMPEQKDMLIFLDGDFVSRRFDPNSMMVYNRATGLYERNMLLKQGAYNYQYLAVPKGSMMGHTSLVEGDNYQTMNQYTIKVYARNPLDRYDRLIGVSLLE